MNKTVPGQHVMPLLYHLVDGITIIDTELHVCPLSRSMMEIHLGEHHNCFLRFRYFY